MPPGQYCDIITGNKEGGDCTGKTITVSSTGNINVEISSTAEDPIMAIHIEVSALNKINERCIGVGVARSSIYFISKT